MIEIKITGEDYEQDIRPLVKSFFPEDSIRIAGKETSREGKKGKDIEEEPEETPDKFLSLELLPEQFSITFQTGEQTCTETEDFSELLPGTYRNEGTPDRRMYRNYLHRRLYGMLSGATGVVLPWGTLTGIRPTKQALERLEQKESREQIAEYFKTEYLCSEEKTELCIQVAEKEQKLLYGIEDKDSYSVYIGIPFCPSICLYCSFSSYSLKQYEAYVEPYLDALFKEIEYAGTCFPEKKLISIYIGGGTPTTLSADQLRRLLRKVKETFDFTYLREWTVEAGRPDSITRDKLVVLKEEGVTRISINPQSMQQKTLDLIGRKHTTEQIKEAFLLARECGHDNINMDLIIGLTGETAEDVRGTLTEIDRLKPDSLTVHTLAVKRAARLNAEMERYKELRSREAVEMMSACQNYTKKNGYEPYYLYRQKNMAENLENIGYAKPGKEGLYNVLIMEEHHTILALGSGGSTKFNFAGTNRLERVENVKSVKDYIERIDEMIERKRDFIRSYGEFL
ncbi:MAG: coproporphyrinogen dehydrogenase HemZ [Lachnospiraceae bacterium]|nr:coproporphyrinogen dehydrogenase HemZ [Lachnospiraceae bacterium]